MDKKLHLSRTNRIIAGVCGGVGEYFNVDPTLIRIAFVILMFMSFGFPMVILYIILWAIIPLES